MKRGRIQSAWWRVISNPGKCCVSSEDDLQALRGKSAPFSTGPDSVFVAYFTGDQQNLAASWRSTGRCRPACWTFLHRIPLPYFRSSGAVQLPGLLGALASFGLSGIEAVEKDSMRGLAMRGGPYSNEERRALLEYCETDVDALARLLPAMAPRIDLPRSLLRGRYMAAAARMEWMGVPIDMETFPALRARWGDIQDDLIRRMDKWGIWDGRSFKTERFAAFLSANKISWPQLPSGSLALDDDTFRMMAKAHPILWPIRELRHSLSCLRLNTLTVGPDGRNRYMLSAFGSKTSRNQPSNSKAIFGPSVWLRGLIKPAEGRAIAYVDWEQQEFGIAAALSGDKAMLRAYTTGDPYLEFAKQAGAVPPDATKKSHPKVRERFKCCALGVQYGMGEVSLGMSLGESPAVARELLRLHRETYRTFWAWSNAAVQRATLYSSLHTVFGWRVHVGPDVNPRSLANFPMQANGAEMLRLACCTATEAGLTIAAPVHDAVLIEAPVGEIDSAVEAMQGHMRRASEVVLNGYPLRTDVSIVRFPDRYMDPRGEEMWRAVMDLIRSPLNTPFGGHLATCPRNGTIPARFRDTRLVLCMLVVMS